MVHHAQVAVEGLDFLTACAHGFPSTPELAADRATLEALTFRDLCVSQDARARADRGMQSHTDEIPMRDASPVSKSQAEKKQTHS